MSRLLSSDDDFMVPVKVWLKPALYRGLAKTAETHKVQVGDLVAECVRRQLAGAGPLVPVAVQESVKRSRPWAEADDADFARFYARGWSDNRIAKQIGRSQGTVSAHRRAAGLPAHFSGRVPREERAS